MKMNKNISDEILIFPSTIVKGLLLVILGSLTIAVAIFFIFLESKDIVVVPNLNFLSIEDAIVELQSKELIPYFEFKFSASSLDRGRVMDQEPKPGTVLRLGDVITIFISKGAVINKVDNFIGKNIEDVLINLKANSFNDNNTKFRYHIVTPLEIESELPRGTIIRQNPSPGSQISSSIELQFLVSKGETGFPGKYVKNYVGLYYKDAIASLLNDEISFDINFVNTDDFGNVSHQSFPSGTKIGESDIILLTIAKPRIDNNAVFGVLAYKLNRYPSSVDMFVRVRDHNGDNYLIYSFRSRGGLIKLPYEVSKGSIIEFYIYDKLVNQASIN